MIASALAIFIASLALTGVTASPTTEPTTPATTSPPCLPPNSMCGVEAQWRGTFFGHKEGLANPQQCLEFCNADRTWGECKSFSFDEAGVCWIHNKPASEITNPKAGSDYWIWDRECWECGEPGPVDEVPTRTTSATTATTAIETCLSPTAKCEVEAAFTPDEGVTSWGTYTGTPGTEKGPYECWEVCTDARRPRNCQSFSWDPSTGTCVFYGFGFDQTFSPAPGSGLWAWDIGCWTCGVSGYM